MGYAILNSMLHQVAGDEFYVIAVDIGGTSYRVALADAAGNMVNRKTQPTRSWESPVIGMQRVKDTIKEIMSEVGLDKIKAIVVCAAGPLDPQKGILLTPPSLPAWRNVPVKVGLENEFPIPVRVENDADLAALGEQRFGAGKGCNRLIYITVSTGIGGGVIIDGNILTGTDLSVAEIGHIVVDPNGPICNCGGKGHVETLSSGTAISRIAGQRINAGESSRLWNFCEGDTSKITGQMVIDAAQKGDALAIDVIESSGKYLGMAIASLMHLFDPEVVIIGGGVSNAGELLLKPARQSMDECSMADFKGRTRVFQSELGDDSGIMGAIALALDSAQADNG